ncbi:conserved protein of unknown function [Xenorhabdus poinarii G6]|uniref:Uncharacterized protein n=1 Tax=Xenorhabdus poinarii G6 TaxID=1354304 RepID=A0A068QXN8_9GAMM|nr:conserved protein of unknown function [Xenorhabdus poinarii G6]
MFLCVMKNNLRLIFYSVKSPAYAGDFFGARKDDETALTIVKGFFRNKIKNSY